MTPFLLRLPRERREAERKLEEFKKNRSIAVGRQKGFEDEILRYRLYMQTVLCFLLYMCSV